MMKSMGPIYSCIPEVSSSPLSIPAISVQTTWRNSMTLNSELLDGCVRLPYLHAFPDNVIDTCAADPEIMTWPEPGQAVGIMVLTTSVESQNHLWFAEPVT